MRWIPLALALFAGCGRASRDMSDAAQRGRRCRELLDSLPRVEAEQRAWPRSNSLACDERGAAAAQEIEQLRLKMTAACAELPARAELEVAFEAVREMEQCAGCAAGYARHCAQARDLLVETQLAMAKAGLR